MKIMNAWKCHFDQTGWQLREHDVRDYRSCKLSNHKCLKRKPLWHLPVTQLRDDWMAALSSQGSATCKENKVEMILRGSLSVTQTGLDLTMLSQISFNSWQASCLSLQSASINYRCKLLCLAFHAILSQCLVSRCISSKIPAEVFGLWLALWVSWGLLQTTAVPYPTLPFDFLLPREPLSIM